MDEVDDLQAEDLDEPPSSHMLQKYDTSKFGKRMHEHTETTSQKTIEKQVRLETPRSKNYDTASKRDASVTPSGRFNSNRSPNQPSP